MNSQIILCNNINLDRDYNNVLSYSENEMLELCMNNKIVSSGSYSFLRPTGTILVEFNYSQCLQSTYMAFQNPDYSNKWFFAWIDEVIYKGDKSTEIKFTVDEWSTWYDYWARKACYVIREHVIDDTIGLHTVPENIDVGEVIEEQETEDSSYVNTYGYWIAIQSSWKIKDGSTGLETSDSDKGTQFAGVTVYDNTVFGSQIFFIHITQISDFVNLYLFIARSNMDGHVADIQNIYVVPDMAINQSQLTSHSASLDNLSFTFYTIAYDMTPETFNTTITKRTSFTGLTVKNNKCFVYPYNYLLVSNNQGSHNIFKYEDFSSTNCVFENQFSISCGGSGRIVPKNYKGMTENDDEALPLGKYPTCAWSSDAYTNWLTQNSVNLAINSANMLTSLATSTNSVSTGLSTAGNIAGIIGQFRQASLLPNINGGQATGDIIWATNRNLFSFREMRVKNEYMKIIDDYFTRFGYAIKRVKIPNITGRRYWNYVEIGSSEEIGYGTVPDKYMNTINNACRKGVTIWHDHDKVGDFSLNNTIIID